MFSLPTTGFGRSTLGEHYLHKATRSWTSFAFAIAVLVVEFSLGAAAQTPQNRWDYAFRVDASAGGGQLFRPRIVAGERGDGY